MTHRSSLESSLEISADVNLVSIDGLLEHTQDVFNLVAQRAFAIFENRGHVHGNDWEDWFLAESELRTPVKFRLSESGERLTARAEVPGFHRQEIKLSLQPRRLSISGKTEPRENHKSEKHPNSDRHSQLMFNVIDLPCEVDASKAKASFNDGRLKVVMPKATPARSVREETRKGLPPGDHSSVQEPCGIGAGSRPAVTAPPSRSSRRK